MQFIPGMAEVEVEEERKRELWISSPQLIGTYLHNHACKQACVRHKSVVAPRATANIRSTEVSLSRALPTAAPAASSAASMRFQPAKLTSFVGETRSVRGSEFVICEEKLCLLAN